MHPRVINPSEMVVRGCAASIAVTKANIVDGRGFFVAHSRNKAILYVILLTSANNLLTKLKLASLFSLCPTRQYDKRERESETIDAN